MFTERYPHLPPVNKQTFKGIESDFIQFGKATFSRPQPKTVMGEEEN